MLLTWLMLTFSEANEDLSLPILRRIAKDNEWPPLKVYIYPKRFFSSKFRSLQVKDPRFLVEKSLPELIKKAPIYCSSPKDADLYLIPIPLSELTPSDLAKLLEEVSKYPYYDEYHGANHIFLHSVVPSNKSAFNPQTFLQNHGHIITSGFKIEGDYVKTWVYAKNILLPLKPFTKFIENSDQKEMKVSVDVSTEGCTQKNADIRRNLEKTLTGKPDFVLSHDSSEAIKLMESSQFSIVSACKSEMAEQFFDALNALSIPVVFNDAMRFPFESELIDYTDFVVHINETQPQDALSLIKKLEKHVPVMKKSMESARRMLEIKSDEGRYVWALSWSLYMKLLTWLPIRRNKIIDTLFNEPTVFRAA